MSMIAKEERDRIDCLLKEWRQGDVIRGPDLFFVHVPDLSRPLTPEAVEAAAAADAIDADETSGPNPIVYSAEHGLVVLTQTCDLVQPCTHQSFVQLAPLIPARDENDFRMVKGGRRPRYAIVPAVEDEQLVAELDRVMTVEKAVVADWTRTPGCRTDEERRAFARALARKWRRTAFPGDFVTGTDALQERLTDKSKRKNSMEGQMLLAIREIRVRAAPSWYDNSTTLVFWFIRADDDSTKAEDLLTQIEEWIGRLRLPERFRLDDPPYRLRRLEDMTAREYLESDQLDLDHLTRG